MSNSRQAVWVLFGSISAFSFSILSSIILSRYFNKVDYGTYKQILYVYGTLLTVFTLGLPKTYSFFLPRLPINEASSAIRKITSLLFICGLCLSLVLFIGSSSIAHILRNEQLSILLKYFSLVPLFLLPTLGLEGILATFKQTRLIALFKIITNISLLLFVVIPVVVFEGGVTEAVIGFTTSSFISLLSAEFLKQRVLKKIEPKKTSLTYKELFNYAIPLFYASFWGVIISSSDQFFISRYFGTEVFADYSNGSLRLPFISMIVAATSIVLSPIYSRKAFDATIEAKQEIIRLWQSVFTKTVKLTYPLIAFFWFFSHSFMSLIYGPSYYESGDFFQVKLLVEFFIVMTYGPLIISIGGHKFYYKVHLYGAIALILLQGISVYFIHSAILVTWISVICHITRILFMLRYIANYFETKLYNIIPWKVIIKVSPCFLFLYIIKKIVFIYISDENLLLILSLSGITYAVIFFIWSLICQLNYIDLIKPFLQKSTR